MGIFCMAQETQTRALYQPIQRMMLIIVFVLLPCWKHHVVGDQLSLQLPFPQTAGFQKLLHLRGFGRYFHNVDLR